MAWFVLVVAGVLEAVWATALGRSEWLTRLVPSLVFAGGLVLSMGGLALALRDLPTGTAEPSGWASAPPSPSPGPC